MSSKLYSVFKETGSLMSNDLIFSQKGYVKHKIYFKDLRLLIIHLPERTSHFICHFNFHYVYHEGDELTAFLKANRVPYAEYHLTTLEQKTSGKYEKVGGGTMSIRAEWVQAGWNYTIIDNDKKQPDLHFNFSRRNKIRFDHKQTKVEFVTQGEFENPEIQAALKEVKKSKRADRVFGCIIAILIIVAFFLGSKVMTWIFGEPEDPFNILMPHLLHIL